MSYTIRRATEADLLSIARIYNREILEGTATFDTEPWTDDLARRWFEAHGPRYAALVAELDGRVAGWAGVSPYGRRPGWAPTVEGAVYVAPEARGRGMGSALLGKLLEEARSAGHRLIVAQVVEGNAASTRLHMRHGFSEVGTLREAGLKFGRRLDVTILQRMLSSGPSDVPGGE